MGNSNRCWAISLEQRFKRLYSQIGTGFARSEKKPKQLWASLVALYLRPSGRGVKTSKKDARLLMKYRRRARMCESYSSQLVSSSLINTLPTASSNLLHPNLTLVTAGRVITSGQVSSFQFSPYQQFMKLTNLFWRIDLLIATVKE